VNHKHPHSSPIMKSKILNSEQFFFGSEPIPSS
jgi:hypothetical protein